MPTADTTSDWDFAPVTELLRSPTLCYSAPSSTADYEKCSYSTQAAEQAEGSSYDRLNRAEGYPRLGDFGLLWDFLNRSETPISENTLVTDAHSDTCADSLPSPSLQSKSSDIAGDGAQLGEAAEGGAGVKTKQRSYPKAILRKCEVDVLKNHTSCRGSSAAIVSDVNYSVFDPSLSTKRGGLVFTPAQVGVTGLVTKSSNAHNTPPSSYEEPEFLFTLSPSLKNLANECFDVKSTYYRSAAERRVGLISKLLKKFPDYAERVCQLGKATADIAGSSAAKIHVFVDISNISAGFHNAVKTSRNIPVRVRIPRLPLSFHNFSLILERGRPATKRVLVGSDRCPAIFEAENIGYETNILDRVHKVKHLTSRRLKHQNGQGFGSLQAVNCSETDMVAEERWVEQGVDEILHLKILESVIDANEPATIVLATGDAAEAEYSAGFMKMVDRALTRGWSVELVSFSQATSYAYRKKGFRVKWGTKFRIIMLDDYVEELIDTK